MQLKYKFFTGGDWNPYIKDSDEAYHRITEERNGNGGKEGEGASVDGDMENLRSWPDYVLNHSKAVFWEMERDIWMNGADKSVEIEDVWAEANDNGAVGKWLKDSEADDAEKSMCFYMAALHERLCPNDRTVDFRLYISEGGKGMVLEDDDDDSNSPYSFFIGG